MNMEFVCYRDRTPTACTGCRRAAARAQASWRVRYASCGGRSRSSSSASRSLSSSISLCQVSLINNLSLNTVNYATCSKIGWSREIQNKTQELLLLLNQVSRNKPDSKFYFGIGSMYSPKIICFYSKRTRQTVSFFF